MEIIQHVTRSLVENVYIVKENNSCFVVDPGYDFEGIKNIIKENSLEPKFIILTHGHGDHIGSVQKIKDLYNIPVYAHEEEKELLEKPELNLSSSMYGNISIKADYYLKDNDEVKFEGSTLKVIHTPGHTKGGMCILLNNNLFTGDTLFAGSIGRSDFPTGNYDELINSVNNKLMILDDDIVVYPGHNSATTIGRERVNNPYVS